MTGYTAIAVFFTIAALFALLLTFLSSLFGPKSPNERKSMPYECGIIPKTSARIRFPLKYSLIAMLFILFELEIVFLYPWALYLKELNLFGLAEMGVFLFILMVAYFYIWKRGGLNWE